MIKHYIESAIRVSLDKLIEQDELPNDLQINIQLERTRDKKNGDYASNIAMVLAKAARKKPRDLANLIVKHFPENKFIKDINIAGPGFINFYLTNDAVANVVKEVLQQGDQFGLVNIGQGKKINVEFVSANPTGPLHVGHGRGAAFGATLADLLSACGYNVECEYYVNDAGRQMNILAASVWLRYLELTGMKFQFPSNGYKGEYVKAIAKDLLEQHGKEFARDITEVFANVPEDEAADGRGDKEAHIDGLIANAKRLLGEGYQIIFQFSLNEILNGIREDLKDFGVIFQNWFSEASLKAKKAIEHAIAVLQEGGHLYERDGATWFNSSGFGDDKDRVLIRDNGDTTYFASDIAYLLDKIERGYEHIIYVLGADHHGYVPRLKAAAKAFGIDPDKLHVSLVQFANLYRGKEKVQMSTRSGSFVTLRDLYEEVGKDAARFFYIMRKNEQHMDFDLELAKSKSSENPVYYIQYAHARICSVFRQLDEKGLSFEQAVGLENLSCLTEPHEQALLTDLSRCQEVLTNAASNYEPHLLVNYLRELANDLHTYYNAHQFIVADAKLRNARLCLIAATKQVLANTLTLLSVSAPQEM